MSMHIEQTLSQLTSTVEFTVQETRLLKKAAKLLDSKLRNTSEMTVCDSSRTVKDLARLYCTLTHATKEQEVLSIMFLDNQHRLIETRDMFFGTINSAVIYVREIVKAALLLNSAAIILIHNHPSGSPAPSHDDIKITKRIEDALSVIDVKTLDHIIVGGLETVSMQDYGLM